MSQLQAGVYRVDITPPVGVSLVGYYARDGVSEGIERPLTAAAVVLATGETKIAGPEAARITVEKSLELLRELRDAA